MYTKPPSTRSVREQCVHLERKVLWRWHRDTKGILDGDAPFRISNMPVAECGTRNMLGNTRLCFKMLRESEICAMPCDKRRIVLHNPHHRFSFATLRSFESSGYFEECDPDEPHESSAGIRILVKSTFQILSPITEASMAVVNNRRGDRGFYGDLIHH